MNVVIYQRPNDGMVSVIYPALQPEPVIIDITPYDENNTEVATPPTVTSDITIHFPTYREFINAGETDDAAKLRFGIDNLDVTLECFVVDSSTLPNNRYFRNAWCINNGQVSINMDMARAIHLEKLRILRNEKLNLLDKLYMIALENNNESEKNNIALLKQQLRDMPATLNLATINNADELMNTIPDYLQ